jgi:phosphoribosyl 1,2-cyclic phosphodiesterase
MGIRFSVLSSGSTGNATIIQSGNVNLLIDVGLGIKQMEKLMSLRGVTGQELTGILVTHEHSDHIKGLGVFARKYNLPIYANENTWKELQGKIGLIHEKNKCIMETHSIKYFGSLKVESFAISHDAAEPVGYCFYDQDQKLSVVTDLGYMSSKVKNSIKDSDGIILEANHDVDMVRMGKYPWYIKQRILGDKGHLSNEAAADGLVEILSTKTKCVYLAHISLNHNLIEIARMTVEQILEKNGVHLQKQGIRIMDTYHDRPTEWEHLAT